MLSAVLSSLPKLISLISLIMSMIRESEQRGVGRTEAVAEALENAHKDIAYANAVEEEARRVHEQNPESDAGFDADYRRAD